MCLIIILFFVIILYIKMEFDKSLLYPLVAFVFALLGMYFYEYQKQKSMESEEEHYELNYKLILGVGLVVGGLVYLYMKYFMNNKQGDDISDVASISDETSMLNEPFES